MFDMNNDQVIFIVKNKDWVSIKKLLIDEHVKPEDVSLILAQIQKTINEKSFLYAGINTEKIDEIVENYAKGKRKGIASLAETLSSIKTPNLKKELVPACETDKHYPLAEQYFISKLAQAVGYCAHPNTDILQKIYPNLKITKPRGNYGKKKKK